MSDSDKEEKKGPSWDDPETRRVWTSLIGGELAAKFLEIAGNLQEFATRAENPETGLLRIMVDVRGTIVKRAVQIVFGAPGSAVLSRHSSRAVELAQAMVHLADEYEKRWALDDAVEEERAKAAQTQEPEKT